MDRLDQMTRVLLICYDIKSDEQQLKVIEVNERIYENQLLEDRILLILVTLITLSGVALSALQLYGSYQLALKGQGALADGGSVDLAPSHVAVRSSVVGVVILAISLAFFAIFIVYVYQIKPYAALTGPAAGATASSADETPPKGTQIK